MRWETCRDVKDACGLTPLDLAVAKGSIPDEELFMLLSLGAFL